MAFLRSTQLLRCAMSGEGIPQWSARFDFFKCDQEDRPRGPVAMSLVLVTQRRNGVRCYEVSGITGEAEKFFLRAEKPALSKWLREARFRSSGATGLDKRRDRALAMTALSAFFGVPTRADSDDAASALTFHLAAGSGEDVKEISDVWMRCDRGYQVSAQALVEGMSQRMVDVIGDSNREQSAAS
jgi:hypothetical protein